MDSSHYNPSYGQWNTPYSSHPPSAPLLPPPPPLPPPPTRQSHPESPNYYGRSTQSGGQHQDYHHYSHRQDLSPKLAVNQPSSYYSQHPQPLSQQQHPQPLPQQQHPQPLPQQQHPQQHPQYIPQQVSYESQRISQPSSSIPCATSRDISQSAWVGFTEKRHVSRTVDAGQGRIHAGQGQMDISRSRVDPGPGHNYQYDYSRSSRDSSGVSINRGLDGSSRSRDEFRSLGYVRKESGATRIEGNYQDRGQLKSESGRYLRALEEGNRGLSSSVGYGSDRYGVTVSRDMTRSSASHEGTRNQRWDEAHNGRRTLYPRKKDDYDHSEIEQYFDRGRREENNESNRTPRNQMQKKSALLRLETPRSHQNGRENDWSRHHSHCSGKKFNSNSFMGKEHLGHSDRGLVEKQRGRTLVDLDVSCKSNVTVAEPVASPTDAGIHPGLSMTPRSSKARRALLTAKNEKASVTEGNDKLRTETPGDSGVLLSRAHSHANVKTASTHVKGHVVSVPHRDFQSKTSLSSNYSSQKSYPCSLPFASDTKKDANPSTHITKRQTWHRNSDTSASPYVAAKPLLSTLSTQQKIPKVTAQSRSSYVRKGNSLLRKPLHGSPGVAVGMPPSAIQLNRFTVEDKSTRSASGVDVDNASLLVKTGEIPTLERHSKPPSDSSTSKVSTTIATSYGKCVLSHSMDHLTAGLPESVMDSATSGEAKVPHSVGDTFKTSDTLIQTGYASDCLQQRNPSKLDSSSLKKMVYVKRKANQLVAASDIHDASKSQIPLSYGYFKRSKNQLVRNSKSHVNQSISLPDDALDSRATTNMVSEISSSSAFSDSAVMRPYKQSKFSLVWTQNDAQSRMPIDHLRYQRILPQLVPWKRVTYWRRLMNSVSALRNGSFSNISRKLSMMRKRHTVYTRSTNGYSLRKSKVLSIGGSHLKWSKSIERDSRKANEEATLAVAAFAKKESEKHSGQSNTRTTSRNHLARDRVFRFGSLRYKMDSSRRTLQRISDVDSPCSATSEIGKGAKRPFIPKRLVIGNEEYVRVGNGNQLVRDPKKRTRVLANEKVRWSLHNVRLRLAKKKKYCQFFTRFGKCNKDDGKCSYVHDPSKIAVCTKFLNGLCANANCRLTHKVIPERMPDCSYFLQGLCNNEACPYRHVHVNPSAPICDGFLKGYCSDGDECRKKHSYTCPVFEATGSCSQGSKCKLHHPKNQNKERKRKRPSEPSEKNSRGRYFGSLHKVFSESEPMVVDTNSEVFGMEGLDFITLGATEYEAGENNDPATEQSISGDSEAPVSIYNLIRPVALMQ